MANDLIVNDEQAKAVQEGAKLGVKALEVVEAAGGWVSDVLGDVPKNLVGVLGGDRLRCYRDANLNKAAAKAREYREARGVTDPQPVSLTIAVPLLQAAAEESRPELQDLWARLLANATDPKRNTVRLNFIEAVKRMEPLDALVLQKVKTSPNSRDAFAQTFKVPPDQVEIAFENLTTIGCLVAVPGRGPANPDLTAFGRELMRALE